MYNCLICRADLDPIYFCELATLCKVKDDGDAKIIALTVNPKTVDYGETTPTHCLHA